MAITPNTVNPSDQPKYTGEYTFTLLGNPWDAGPDNATALAFWAFWKLNTGYIHDTACEVNGVEILNDRCAT